MKNFQLTILLITLFFSSNIFSQVVSGDSKSQPVTVKPGELGGSSFNGDVNLYTGTYSGSYTLGSVATPGGLKYDVNMVYSSSLMGGDNVPVASGIPYGEGWSVQVPTISLSIADYKSYSDEKIQQEIAYHKFPIQPPVVDDEKSFVGDGNLYWFAPMVNIPGVASGKAVFKFLDPTTEGPIFVLETFDNQYIELLLWGNQWEATLPDGTKYLFNGSVSYRKGYNKRTHNYTELYNDAIGESGSDEQYNTLDNVNHNIRPKGEMINWHCTRISNRNMPHQFIFFNYEGYGKFNFFKEFSADYQEGLNEALRPPPGPGPFSTASGYPNLEVVTDVILKKVHSTYHATIDQVVLEYESDTYYGPDMLNPNLSEVTPVDNMYNSQVVYRTSDEPATATTPFQAGTQFTNWNRHLHAKHPDLVDNMTSSWQTQPSSTNPFIGVDLSGNFNLISGATSFRFRQGLTTGPVVDFDHGFLESPRLKHGHNAGEIPLIGGDIYEIKTTISNPCANCPYGYANIDINIATGKDYTTGVEPWVGFSNYSSGLEVMRATERDNNYVNETIFSTFGNAVKWNPVHDDQGTLVQTSNFFTLPNIPDEYNGISIQIGPGNSDNYFDLTPRDVTKITVSGPSPDPAADPRIRNAHRTYWAENLKPILPGGWSLGNRNPMKQPYEAVPNNFGVGLPWMMMKPLAHKILGNLDPDETSAMFNFWWNDYNTDIGFAIQPTADYTNVPTLLGEATLSQVELVRYSKNPYMLQSVKTYKTNGETTDSQHANPGTILVNQFDLEYDHKDVNIVDNVIYDATSAGVNYTGRNTTSYLLKNIKNIPVNGSQDASNQLPVTNNEVPTTHFEYLEFEPGLPLTPGNDEVNLRTNASLFVLNKTTSHLGKETSIEYFKYSDPSYPNMLFAFFKHLGPAAANPVDFSHLGLTARNFAVQINIPVKSIIVEDDPAYGNLKQWDYSYDTALRKLDDTYSGNGIKTDVFNSSGLGMQQGWQTTTVTEPIINGLRPYSKYHHHGETGPFVSSPPSSESLLQGRLKKVENFDGNNIKLSQKEIIYETQLAFINGNNRAGYYWRATIQSEFSDIIINNTWIVGDVFWEIITNTASGIPYDYTINSYNASDMTILTTQNYSSLPTTQMDLWYYDYQDCDVDGADPITELHRPQIKTSLGGVTNLATPSACLETSVSGGGDDSYFIKKVKEIDTEYETTVCNVPDITEIEEPLGDPVVPPTSFPPLGPILDFPPREGDVFLTSLIDDNRFGKNIEANLIASSPLSTDVLISLFDKRPYYKLKTYNNIIEAQTILSNTVFDKILLLPNSTRDKVLRTALINQQYLLSGDILRNLIAAQPSVEETIILNALQQYNALPEDILLSIINRNPKYTPHFIQSVLVNQVQLSEDVHDLLLSKNYLPDNVIKNVFVDGASYPEDNTLVTMIDRKPNINTNVIGDVLLASPYQHSTLTMNAVTSNPRLTPLIGQLDDHNEKKPSWSVYCGNTATNVQLAIQNITEFEYWDADPCGETTSEGFRKLLDVTDPTIKLLHEPSWQLYRTKSYSPQLPGAFTEKEYFYYYDLKNKYQRGEDYLPNATDYLFLDDINGPAFISAGPWIAQPFDIMYFIGGNQANIYTFDDQINSLRGFQPPGLKFSHELNLMNIAYQERTTSKNVSDETPIIRSTFYHYDNDWNQIVDNAETLTIPYSLGVSCESDPTGGGSTGDPFIDGGCEAIFKLHLLDVSTVPQGSIVYITDASTVYVCPCELDISTLNVTSTYFDNCTIDPSGGAAERIARDNDLAKTLLLKEVNIQLDTLVNQDYFESLATIPFASSTGLMEFKYGGIKPGFTDILYPPVYPFDVLKVKEIKERNQFTQVQLEANEQGLLTRYWYSNSQNIFYDNTDCPNSTFGSYSGIRSFNIGVPIAITVGYTRSDSLRSDYEYFPDYSVKRIIDPNGITLSYAYDEYGRLKESYRNNKLLSINKYNTWKNDVSLSFQDRSLQNYVETFQLKDDGSFEALQSRKYIDPLGRDFHTMSRITPDATADPQTSTIITYEAVHTGAIIYDNWNRATKTAKPFVDGNGSTSVPWGYVAQSTNTTTYPIAYSLAQYEDDQKSRVLKEAKPGENLTSSRNVKYRYSMANYVCGGCELELSAQEANLIMGDNPQDVRFKIIEIEDEDGKVSKEYFNALGQKVATKHFIGTEEAITLFIYDSYGNLTKVINPEKQQSTYDYNLMGWLFQKETVDGGITKYMFNESGKVVLEQDENGKTARTCTEELLVDPVTLQPILDPITGLQISDFVDRPYYRRYTYDIFGRLNKQEKVMNEDFLVHPGITEKFSMLYADASKNVIKTTVAPATNPEFYDLYHDGYYYEPDFATIGNLPSYGNFYDVFVYNFTNNSTYSWKAKTNTLEFVPNGQSGDALYAGIDNFVSTTTTNFVFPEKILVYGGDVLSSQLFHTATNTILAGGRTNTKGNLGSAITYNNSFCEQASFIVKYDIYNYNEEGNLLWQMQQFNSNGIDQTNKGIVTRIDYPTYDLNNNLLVENIDVNNDLLLDLQYNYSYDFRNRLREVKVGLTEDNTHELLASYDYNDATGLVTRTNYHKECQLNNSLLVDKIDYIYDVRDRLNKINSKFFIYDLTYDNTMPNNMSSIANFNGNINGTEAIYNLLGMQNYSIGNSFDNPTSYTYKYDGINRLTSADGYWDNASNNVALNSIAAKLGDVSFEYDKIGNLTKLNRFVDNANTNHEWVYDYQAGSNILNRVATLNVNEVNRNYTYDAAGNLLTDDYRKVNQSIYGRANLPFDLELDASTSTRYLYDGSDARVFKGIYSYTGEEFELGSNIGMSTSSEYYLRDAAGNTVGILDLNLGEWTWYVFGRERFAKIKPDVTQQPKFFAADYLRTLDPALLEGSTEQFVGELTNVLSVDPTIQTQLLRVECHDGTGFWICENNLSNFTDTVQDTAYTIAQEITIASLNQLVIFEEQAISVGVLTGLDLLVADTSIVIDTADIIESERDTITLVDPSTGNNQRLVEGKGLTKFKYSYYDNIKLKEISFYIHDHLGNTRLVYTPTEYDCDLSNNYFDYNLDYAADYYPYGKILRKFHSQSKAERYLTTHHERDDETGLDYRGARYYDADIARFLSLDPDAMNYAQWSPYNYVFGKPISLIDPDGKGGGPPQHRRAIIRRGKTIPNGGKIVTKTYKPILRNVKRDFINYLEPTTSVLDPMVNVGNPNAPIGRVLVTGFADVIDNIKTRQEWSKSSKGVMIKSSVGYIINFNTPGLQAKFDKLQAEYVKKYNAHVKGTYTDAEYKNLPDVVKGVRHSNASSVLGPSPVAIVLKAFKLWSKNNKGDIEVTSVTKNKAVIYESNN